MLAESVNLQEMIHCRKFDSRITFPVVRYSVYDNKAMPDLGTMREIAWEVHSRKRGPIGFAGDSNELITITPPNRYGIGPEVPDDDQASRFARKK